MSFGARKPVVRFAHGSRVPGWDEAVDLTKPPATVPDPALTPVPAELRAEIEAAMAMYPDPKSAAIPALHAAQNLHGWCSPEAIDQVACVMRLTPAYLTSVASFYDMFELTETPRTLHLRLHQHLLLAARRATSSTRRCWRPPLRTPSVNVRGFECLGACDIAPMASVDGEFVGPLVRGRRGADHRRPARGTSGARGQAAPPPALRGPGGEFRVDEQRLWGRHSIELRSP